ncbi:transposase, IS607 family protein [Scytonema sp. HK-05]|uniref:RNA-guided endonuclease InsQ/TnpB family protein n=1 Tax=Scytonema sp. HK-05 TaxID=1137095 RepID=UPI000937FE42|nr:RNA-guided endonuclease TnpB family protein [Scytonema sp. HK-05]OKH52625.1 hypothetical protein NIES2130_31625 [Scytonema sp. HK-05]BAY47358.1 transposase, IS607 family protein [Scytonema sp. HK-05]
MTSNTAKRYFGQIAKTHAHIANIRKDFLQKTTTDISRKYVRIRIEDLNISGMIANHKLSEAISSLGLYEFRRMLTYKQAFYGTKVEIVDRWFASSKTCSNCTNVQPMPLSERIYACRAGCGHIQCRDLNAAINLNNAPLQKIRAVSSALDGFPGLKRLRSAKPCRRHTRRASAKLTPVDRLGADSPQTLQEANFKEFELFDLSDLCKFCVAHKRIDKIPSVSICVHLWLIILFFNKCKKSDMEAIALNYFGYYQRSSWRLLSHLLDR